MKNAGGQSFNVGAKIIDCGGTPHISTYREIQDNVDHELFDYSRCKPTQDQIEINNWLTSQNCFGKSILHVGIGNSSIAKLCKDAAYILGVTVAENEKRDADKLGIDNYDVFLVNKYSEIFINHILDKKFDFIIDNNLASFVCCQSHFLAYLAGLISSLSDNGAIITHWLGMQWILDQGSNSTEQCWALDEDKLKHISTIYDLNLTRHGDVFVLKK